MPIHVTGQGDLIVGDPIVIEGPAHTGPLAAIFEDDGDTGYFYALDQAREDNPIANALHIYNRKNVTDGGRKSAVQIGWSSDGLKALLLINGHPHAIFDFAARVGYCRTNFPPPDTESGWTGNQWDETAIGLFA